MPWFLHRIYLCHSHTLKIDLNTWVGQIPFNLANTYLCLAREADIRRQQFTGKNLLKSPVEVGRTHERIFMASVVEKRKKLILYLHTADTQYHQQQHYHHHDRSALNSGPSFTDRCLFSKVTRFYGIELICKRNRKCIYTDGKG